MRLPTSTLVGLSWNEKRGWAAACAVLLHIQGCGSSGSYGSAACSPPPQITSTPPTTARVGQQYVYAVVSPHECGLVPSTCYDFDAQVLPPGAAVDMINKVITWTPVAGQANMNVAFEIATVPDYCGNRATQSWSVLVTP